MASEHASRDLEAVFDAHAASEFETKDLDATMATVAMSQGFDHVTLVVIDLEEAERFLGVLGFERDKAVVASGETIAAFMGIPGWESDHVTLVLRGAPVRQEVQLLRFHNPAVEIDERSGYLARTGFNHVCFRVDDLDGTLERFADLGHAPRNAVMDFHDRRLVFFDGPAGVVVELAEWKITPPIPGGHTDDLGPVEVR
jgi:catechol 2,3-dioxygenase-like lactoylglutathione lyase family enzyme